MSWILAMAFLAQEPRGLPGLTVEYSTAGGALVRAVVERPAWSLAPGEMPHPLLPVAACTMHAFGWLVVPAAGAWHLAVRGTGTTRVLVLGRPVLQVDGAGESAALSLPAGPVPLEFEHQRQGTGADHVQLWWRGPGTEPEPIPARALSHQRDEETAELRQDLAIDRGRRLFGERRCGACHGASPAAPLPPAFGSGPDLTAVGERCHPDWIDLWLFSPVGVRLSARMPSMFHGGAEDERKAVVAYLASLGAPAADPTWSPGGRAAARNRGAALFVAVGCAACHEPPAVASVPRPGALLPLSGVSRKWNNHGALTAFLLDPSRTHPRYRMPSLLLAADEAAALAAFLLYSDAAPDANPVPPETELVARGRTLTHARRCAACHQLPTDLGMAAPLPSLSPTPAALRRGCLAATPILGAPFFDLRPEDKDDLRAYVRAGCPPARSPAPGHDARGLLDQLFCGQCHALGAQPGQALERSRAVAALLQVPAPEFVAPPPLDTLGHRLRTEWLTQVFADRARARPRQALRMPHFDPDLTRSLPAGLTSWCGEALVTPPAAAEPGADAVAGRQLAGADGLGCVSCHPFGTAVTPRASATAQGPDLLLGPRRLRKPWFQRWLAEPARLDPTTPMPSLLSADVGATQTEALWAYLAQGARAAAPAVADLDPPAAGARPRILHTALPDLPDAIAVGFAGGLSVAFAADTGALALVWQGGFLTGTATAHAPRGETLWRRPPDRTTAAARARLLGYHLTDLGAPVLRVAVDDRGTTLEHSAAPLAGAVAGGLRHDLRLSGPAAALDLPLAVGTVVERSERHAVVMQGARGVLIATDVPAALHVSDGVPAELRCRLTAAAGCQVRILPTDGSPESLAAARAAAGLESRR